MKLKITDAKTTTYVLNPTKIVFGQIATQPDGTITPSTWATATGTKDGVRVFQGKEVVFQSVDPETVQKIKD